MRRAIRGSARCCKLAAFRIRRAHAPAAGRAADAWRRADAAVMPTLATHRAPSAARVSSATTGDAAIAARRRPLATPAR
ncbi:MAG: hypothetical protein HS111_12980 [Kofleriaceae bacterium]|nr:hypothetical protein [Kofleriaceae bacterium]